MKAFTSLEQSRKLAEILPIKSADMYYMNGTKHVLIIPNYETDFFNLKEDDIPCWSLTALLKVLPYPHLEAYDNDTCVCSVFNKNNHFIDDSYGIEPIDVCYEMIIKLYEQKLL